MILAFRVAGLSEPSCAFIVETSDDGLLIGAAVTLPDQIIDDLHAQCVHIERQLRAEMERREAYDKSH